MTTAFKNSKGWGICVEFSCPGEDVAESLRFEVEVALKRILDEIKCISLGGRVTEVTVPTLYKYQTEYTERLQRRVVK